MYNNWETLTSFLFLCFAFPEITRWKGASNSTLPFSCSVFPFLISFLSLLIVIYERLWVVTRRLLLTPCIPQVGCQDLLIAPGELSSLFFFFMVVVIKQKFTTDQTSSCTWDQSPQECWGARWQSAGVFAQTIEQAVGALSNNSVWNCSLKLPRLK